VLLEFFLSFFIKFEKKKKTHNMFSLMLDPRFKSFCLVSSFIRKEQGVTIVEKYDIKSLYPMFKCHHHLHPLVESKSAFLNISVDEDCNLDIFEQNTNISEPMKNL
jgi:hypothetical protein